LDVLDAGRREAAAMLDVLLAELRHASRYLRALHFFLALEDAVLREVGYLAAELRARPAVRDGVPHQVVARLVVSDAVEHPRLGEVELAEAELLLELGVQREHVELRGRERLPAATQHPEDRLGGLDVLLILGAEGLVIH